MELKERNIQIVIFFDRLTISNKGELLSKILGKGKAFEKGTEFIVPSPADPPPDLPLITIDNEEKHLIITSTSISLSFDYNENKNSYNSKNMISDILSIFSETTKQKDLRNIGVLKRLTGKIEDSLVEKHAADLTKIQNLKTIFTADTRDNYKYFLRQRITKNEENLNLNLNITTTTDFNIPGEDDNFLIELDINTKAASDPTSNYDKKDLEKMIQILETAIKNINYKEVE